jgi:threonine dehydrogenase-like Zn-dependent dehydrogenase
LKVATLKAIRTINVEDSPKPSLKPQCAMVKLESTSICGTDVHEYEGIIEIALPRILGHDFSGTVVEIGEGVEETKRGDRVAVIPSFPCGTCAECMKANYAACRTKRLIGLWSDGCHREYMVVPKSNLVKLPDNVSFDEAATLEPFTVALNTFDKLRISVGDTVAILGQGPIGLAQTQLARLSGAGQIIVIDVREEALEFGRKFGATTIINAVKEDPVKRVLEITGGKGVDVVIDCAGGPKATPMMPSLVRREGTMVFVAVGKDIPSNSLPPWQLTSRRLTVYGMGANGGSGQYPRAVDLVSKGLIDVKSLITHRYPFAQISEVFEMLSSRREKCIKAVLYF